MFSPRCTSSMKPPSIVIVVACVMHLPALATLGCGDDAGTSTLGSSTSVETASHGATDGGTSVDDGRVTTADGSGSTGTSSADDTETSANATSTSTGNGETETDTGAQGTGPRVLMLGNSYTQFNDLAAMVGALADDAGADLGMMAITQGGATVADLLARPDVQATLADDAWDIVTIQGQSYEPLIQPLVFEDAAVELATLVQRGGAEPVLFETWARIDGHPLYDEPWSGGDPAGMQAGLYAGYSNVAELTGGTLAPVGEAWALSLAASPQIVLHSGDGSHPSVEGTYLAAAVFFAVIVDEPATGNGWWPASVAPDDAALLQGHADEAVAARRK